VFAVLRFRAFSEKHKEQQKLFLVKGSVTGLEPAAVSLAAFLHAALHSFLKYVSMTANSWLRRMKKGGA